MKNRSSASNATATTTRYIKKREVCEIAGVSSNTITAMEKSGRFPKGKFINVRAKRWLYSEVMEWAANPEGWKPSAA